MQLQQQKMTAILRGYHQARVAHQKKTSLAISTSHGPALRAISHVLISVQSTRATCTVSLSSLSRMFAALSSVCWSVRMTRVAPNWAAVRPTAPVPAPSSMTFFSRTTRGWRWRNWISACVQGNIVIQQECFDALPCLFLASARYTCPAGHNVPPVRTASSSLSSTSPWRMCRGGSPVSMVWATLTGAKYSAFSIGQDSIEWSAADPKPALQLHKCSAATAATMTCSICTIGTASAASRAGARTAELLSRRRSGL